MDPYASRSQSNPQPGLAQSVQPAQRRPWKPSMVPSSQAGSMPPLTAGAFATVNGARRLARPAEGQLQAPSQPRMTLSQPNSFQEYAPSGTPDRQYMLPGDQRQPQSGNAGCYMPSSQPSSGVDSVYCISARPSNTQSFSQARPIAFSPAHHQRQRYSQLPPTSSMRPVLASQRQPSPAQMQQRCALAQQQPVRVTQRPLHFTSSQPGSQVLTPQSSQTQRISQAHQHSQAVQGSQGVQLQSSQGLQIPSSQDLLLEGNPMAQPSSGHGRTVQAHDTMLAQTTRGTRAHVSPGQPSLQLEQGTQAMPRMYLTQPSQDTFAWSEETQADPPLPANALTDAQAMHHCTMQQGLLEPANQPSTDPGSVSMKPAHSGTATVGAAAAGDPPRSRLRMKMKSLAAAAAINNAAAGNHASASDSRQRDADALPSEFSPAHAADLGDQAGEHLANLPTNPNTSEQAAAAEAAAEVAAGAAKAAAAQVQQALEVATAAQDACKAMAVSATAAATANKETLDTRHDEVLSRFAGMQGSCTTLSSAVVTLQSSCDTQAAKLSAVESTCQTLLSLLHGLSAQTQQAVVALEARRVQQPAVTVLRCLESATQTSPVRVLHQTVQAEVSPMAMGLTPGADQAVWTGKQPVANTPTSTAEPAAAAGMPHKASDLAPSQRKPQAHAEPVNTASVPLYGTGRQGQDKPGQKRKQAPSGLQQHKVKQQRVVYNEFSTSTESTTASDRSAPSVDSEGNMSPHEQPAHHPALKQQQQQRQQQHHMPESDPAKVISAPRPANRRHIPGPVSCSIESKQGARGSQPAVLDQKASGPPPLKSYSRKAAKSQKRAITGSAAMDKAKQAAVACAAEPTEPTTHSKLKQSAVQEGSHVQQTPTPAGGFADLLHAMLGDEGGCYSAPQADHETANPVLDRQPVHTTPQPNALGDVTNTQSRVAASASKHPAGKARTAAAAAGTPGNKAIDKVSEKLSAPTGKNGTSKDESKGASRRSARVRAKNQSDKVEASPAVELFSGAYQESMPSIDDEDIERQVKERMQRHRLKNQKRFSRMKP